MGVMSVKLLYRKHPRSKLLDHAYYTIVHIADPLSHVRGSPDLGAVYDARFT
jgi:hypothetical protein